MLTFYMVSYDIADDGRRALVAKILEGYGERRQRSVFECHLTDAQFAQLWQRLEKAMDAQEDSVLGYELCRACVGKVRSLGISAPTLPEAPYYLV